MNTMNTKIGSGTPVISFVIPQKGRLDHFENTLRSIAVQELHSDSVEGILSLQVVIVTQDIDPEESCKLVERILSNVEGVTFQCIVAQEMGATISTLRNRAAAASTGKYLAFIDADIRLSSNWCIDMMALLISDENKVLVSAMQVAGHEPTYIEKIQVQLNALRVDSEVGFLSGHNLLLSRDAYNRAGGFPEHLKTCEDSVFTDSVGNIGILYRSSKASYVHLGEDRSLGEVFRKEKWRSNSNFATLHGRNIRAVELVSFVAPMIVIISCVIAATLVLFAKFKFSLIVLLLGLTPVFAYSFRLWLSSAQRLRMREIVSYYLTYFLARGIGMTLGIRSTVSILSTTISRKS